MHLSVKHIFIYPAACAPGITEALLGVARLHFHIRASPRCVCVDLFGSNAAPGVGMHSLHCCSAGLYEI